MIGIAGKIETLAILGFVTELTVVREFELALDRYYFTLIWDEDGPQKVKFTVDYEDTMIVDDLELYFIEKAKEAVNNARSNK